jgi:hypothetical protein
MADVRDEILIKYDIDINEENILKLYKIEKPDITADELNACIKNTRERWQKSINGANEKNAKRDQARLDRADKYEQIIKNDTLRKKLYDFHTNGGSSGKAAGKKTGNSTGTSLRGVEFAREYFKLVGKTTTLKNDDVDFFFEFYQAERKNKKAILDMLKSEFKIIGINKVDNSEETEDSTDAEETEESGKKKENDGPFVVNKFKKETVLNIGKCLRFKEQAAESSGVKGRYPKVSDSLYDFFETNKYANITEFSQMIKEKRAEFFSVRQEHGNDYKSLVDLINTIDQLVAQKDVIDNYKEFTLLLKYPGLSSYMYSFVKMKNSTMDDFVKVAKNDYGFLDRTDFLINYYEPIYDNFGISNDGALSKAIKKAKKSTLSNKVVRSAAEKIGLANKKGSFTLGARLVYFMVYWPVFFAYLIFEVIRLIFSLCTKLPIPIFIILFILENWFMPWHVYDIFRVFSKPKWIEFVNEYFYGMNLENAGEWVFATLLIIVWILVAYIVPPALISIFLDTVATVVTKDNDLMGIKRTFKLMFDTEKAAAMQEFEKSKNFYYKKMIPRVLVNLLCVGIIVAIFIIVPLLLKATGYF